MLYNNFVVPVISPAYSNSIHRCGYLKYLCCSGPRLLDLMGIVASFCMADIEEGTTHPENSAGSRSSKTMKEIQQHDYHS